MSVAKVKAVPNAPMEVAKHIAPEEMRPGINAGIKMSFITYQGEAPSERAASSKLASIFSAPQKESCHGIGKHEFFTCNGFGDLADKSLTAHEKDDHETNNDSGKSQGECEH